MATKAKSDTSPKSKPAPARAPEHPLAAAFGKAVKLLDAGKAADAGKAFQDLIKEAEAGGDWAMKRRAQVYAALAEGKAHPAKPATADSISEIQACLNRRQTTEAMKLLDKELKAHAGKAVLHYLRAVAFAQSEQVEPSAEALRKALDLDGDLVFQWHMEPDFNAIRKSPLFAFTEGR